MVNRREFIALGSAAVGSGCVSGVFGRPTLDENLIVFLSDIHIYGTLDPNGAYGPYGHCLEGLKLEVEDILSRRRLPANVVVTGDVAYDIGTTDDYLKAREILKPLYDAGIRVTLGMGNHDKRAAFFEIFPEYASSTPVPGRVVSVVKTPKLDVILLDSLNERPTDPKIKTATPKTYNTVTGCIDGGQVEWMEKVLPNWGKLFILASHHPLREPLINAAMSKNYGNPNFVGYIYGHVHYWCRQKKILWGRPNAVVPVLSLPSADFYGDIGHVDLEISDDRAVATLCQRDFYYPKPIEDAEKRPREWEACIANNDGEQCTFLLPDGRNIDIWK